MDKMILSLKNIYMLLMTEDFPIYSESVIGRNERKGQTMLRFWYGHIAEEFRCLPCGQMIWRNDGKRNRYTSYLCNRSAELKTYSEYAKEIASQVSVPALLNQISRFMEFLYARKYRHDILLRRTRELMRMTEAEDPRLSDEIVNQIQETVSWQPGSGDAKLFQAAYLLTVLMLYAAAGEAMDDPVMAVLQTEEYGINAIFNAYMCPQDEAADVTFLTVHSGLLQDNPLPQHRFFGREEELFNLKEIASSGRKCLIQGIGGIGKTELLRQLIRICVEEKTVDKIAVVPYEGGIIESFARCFPGFQRQNPEDIFHSVLYRLAKESEQGKVLLLIDNLTNGLEEDPNLQQLQELPCGILITTRRGALEGFETYTMDNPTIGTGSLIFRDNFGKPLNREDQKVLTQMLSEEALCHPLTLRLMARAARNRGWSVQEMKDQLERKNALSWREDDRTVRFNQVYHQLYSYLRIPAECQGIAELFTLLPRDSYSLDFLKEWFPDVMDSGADEKLEALTEGGWLDQDETGFSMHPLIAQCLRRTVITEEKINPLVEKIQAACLRTEYYVHAFNANAVQWRIANILVQMVSFLTGPISCQLLNALLRAVYMTYANLQNQKRHLQMIERIMKRCREKDDETQILHLCVQSNNRVDMEQKYMEAYEKQKAKLTVPKPLFMEFCVSAGLCMCVNYQFENAQKLLEDVICEDAAPMQKVRAYDSLIGCAEYRGAKEDRLKWSEAGVAYVREHSECGDFMLFTLLSNACQSYIMFGHWKEAEGLLIQIKEVRNRLQDPKTLGTYHATAALYEMSLGNLETAREYYCKCLLQIEEYQGKYRDYYVMIGQIATILLRMKRYEEAVEEYRKVLEYGQKAKDSALVQIFSNNISVAYLEMECPRQALVYLQTSLELARHQGGVGLGEVQRNRARAFGQLGDTGQEYACLKEASPLLDEAYGPDHPRSVAARERLAELENLYHTADG